MGDLNLSTIEVILFENSSNMSQKFTNNIQLNKVINWNLKTSNFFFQNKKLHICESQAGIHRIHKQGTKYHTIRILLLWNILAIVLQAQYQHPYSDINKEYKNATYVFKMLATLLHEY
jgi:hypothetical protein